MPLDTKDFVNEPPIRNFTFQYLVRPAEMDFDVVKFLLMCLTVITLIVSFTSQVEQIIQLCSGPYLCPNAFQAGWSHRPVWAPPVGNRLAAGIKYTTNWYFRETAPSCSLGAVGCETPGYLIEWPYMQTVAGSDALNFPEELKIGCTAVVAGTTGYVYDPLAEKLKGEYWDCAASSTAFGEGGKPFHFHKNWYDTANSVTLKCMAQSKPDSSKWATSVNEFNGALLSDLELCFLNDPVWITLNTGGKCDCKTGNAFWMLWSNSAANIPTHNMYGCFFPSPTAGAPVSLEYYACSSTPAPLIQIGTNSVERQRKEAERTAAMGLSRKTALVVFFLFKEAGPAGAIVGAILVVAVTIVLWLPLGILVQVIGSCMEPHERTHFKNAMWKTAEMAFTEATNTIWPLCLGMSNTFRAWETLRKVFFSDQINASIVKDGINKVTALLNILFNLVVLVFSDTTFAEGGLLWVSIILSAVNVVIQILLEKEKLKFMTSFFKDVNENRLTKFEIAIGMTKCMEDLLEDDVQYNFVQHLGGDKRVIMREAQEFEDSEVKSPGAFAQENDVYDEVTESEMSNGEWRSIACFGSIQNQQNPTIFNFYPLLPKKWANQFGHDGKYEFDNDRGPAAALFATTVFAGKTMAPTPNPVMMQAMPYPMAGPSMPNMMPGGGYGANFAQGYGGYGGWH